LRKLRLSQQVKNYYNQHVENGDQEGWEDIALSAYEKDAERHALFGADSEFEHLYDYGTATHDIDFDILDNSLDTLPTASKSYSQAQAAHRDSNSSDHKAPATPVVKTKKLGLSDYSRRKAAIKSPVAKAPPEERRPVDIHSDELYDSRFTTTTSTVTSNAFDVSPHTDLLQQRLQAAKRQHLEAANYDHRMPGSPRGRSPFRQGSPLAPILRNPQFLRTDGNDSSYGDQLRPQSPNILEQLQTSIYDTQRTSQNVLQHEELHPDTMYSTQKNMAKTYSSSSTWDSETVAPGNALSDFEDETAGPSEQQDDQGATGGKNASRPRLKTGCTNCR